MDSLGMPAHRLPSYRLLSYLTLVSEPITRRVPLDIWALILSLLPARQCWPLRYTCHAWLLLVEEHLTLLWLRHACVDVKLAPYFRIYDAHVAGIGRDPWPLRRTKSQWTAFDRPETGELDAGAWATYPTAQQHGHMHHGAWSGTSTPTPGAGRRANLTKSLWLHKEVTFSLALGGEVSQPMKLRLKILPSNSDAEELGACLQHTPARAHAQAGFPFHHQEPGSREGSRSPELGESRDMMLLSANGRRIRLDWRRLMDRACRQGNWGALVR
ncbi:hypothetical protein DACRYDRAFT_110683 [Dacryopinax primogenitus]|uniref:F-box domain-containing protein n=1 Tax=Dacryopinax primogenitus (strain DJM 731) TaxID=1858805 RepID=M5FPU7_DACPD|nr:uncharacterized protein DACRYDRAFT_110683 [Dacryopinax primogenitus]EJT98790.1 hypothetical protein DACRYDRAFT_110683 [Dacryopinax primogenitus]